MKKIFVCRFIYSIVLFFFSACGPGKTTSTIATDSLSVAAGKTLFQTNCSGCHNFRQDGIGPDLSGITQTDSAGWLKSFIRDPKNLLNSGDERTKKLLSKYHTLMPSFTSLKDEQIDQLIAFLHIHQEHEKEKPDPLAIKDPIPEKIAPSGIQIELSLFAQMPATSDKEPRTRISEMDWVDPVKAWFILDQRGKLYKMVNGKPAEWLNISKWKPHFINEPGLATGLGSFVFHPDFAHNGIFYTTHSESPDTTRADFPIPDTIKKTLQWVLCEWKTSKPGQDSFIGTCRELLRIDMPSQIHGTQEIIFNPRAKRGDEDYGNLYMGVGDGGSVENGYAFLTAHPGKIWGTIIRINPTGKNSANGRYGIPENNPFTKNPDPHTIREIYATGFRNPNLITWTRNGLMLATNIGQANIEAINIIRKGQDYGWPIREGRFAMHPEGNLNFIYPLPANDSVFHIVYPVAGFDHDEGKAIAGGYEYLGKNIPELSGKYLFGDIPSGRLFYINLADLKQSKMATVREWFVSTGDKRISLQTLCGQNRVDLRFARDAHGEMFIFTKPDGKIYRLARISKPDL